MTILISGHMLGEARIRIETFETCVSVVRMELPSGVLATIFVGVSYRPLGDQYITLHHIGADSAQMLEKNVERNSHSTVSTRTKCYDTAHLNLIHLDGEATKELGWTLAGLTR